ASHYHRSGSRVRSRRDIEGNNARPKLHRAIPLMRLSSRQCLAALRIAIGGLFLIFAEYKVFGTGFTLHGGFQYWINAFLQGGAYPVMVPVLRNFVLPHAT